MSRAGPASRAASVCREPGWPGSHVIAKFLLRLTNVLRFLQTDTSLANRASPAHVIRP